MSFCISAFYVGSRFVPVEEATWKVAFFVSAIVSQSRRFVLRFANRFDLSLFNEVLGDNFWIDFCKCRKLIFNVF